MGINVGGGAFNSADGSSYQADQYFSGGNTSTTRDAINQTTDDLLYQSERWGMFTYELPVAPGQYRVTLKFVEMYWNANGSRAIDVMVEGQPAVAGLDVHAMVGHDSAFDIEVPATDVSDGNLSIAVSASTDNGSLSGIAVYGLGDGSPVTDLPSVASGAAIYAAQCTHCHGDDGIGNGLFPSLVLPACVSCSSQADLAARISETMPLDGAKCTGSCAEDVAAYVLATFKKDVPVVTDCKVQDADIRRLTRFEFSNTLYDLLGDDTRPGNALPSEQLGNGFGNDAAAMSVSTLLAEQYNKVADAVAQRAVTNANQWQSLHSCVQTLNNSNQSQCATQIIERLLNRAFRRPATTAEINAYVELQAGIAANSDFKQSIAAVIEAVLQSPDFLYRVEKGTVDPATNRLKPTAYEMATRLSYFFWGSMPDQALMTAAADGSLTRPEGIRQQAERLLADPRSRQMVRFFFDNYLPISSLTDLERDPQEFPTFSSRIGELMREETHAFLEHIIFDGPGDWPSALTAPYSFMNQPLAEFYGISGVFGDEFREVSINTEQRLGLLTQAGIMAGTTHSGKTNPVARGAYVMKKLLCVNIPLPTGDIADQIKPPDPSSGLTARERFGKHSSDPVCRNCHNLMDPVGLVFEHYDPVGLFRTHENNVLIDTSGELPGAGIPVNNALELVTAIAGDERTHQCFAYNWANFAYGKTIGASEACIKDDVETLFKSSDYNIQSLLLNLTQTDAFLYLPADHRQ